MWLAAFLSRRDCELSCDEGAVRLLGEDRRADYGRTLVGLVARRTTAADLACCATTMTGGKSALKERIALLVKRPRTTAAMACLVGAACIVFAACTFSGAAAPEVSDEPDADIEPPQTEDIAEPDEPNPDRDALVKEAVAEMVQDFQENYQLTELWIDPDMGETPGPSYLLLDWIGPSALLEVNSWALKTGGWVECSLDKENYDYYIWEGIGTLTIYGKARYVDCPIGVTLPLRYDCHITEQADGSLTMSTGRLFSAVPEDLPTELMDLSRPAEEQGTWLLLAKCRGYDVALYRSAWDDQHVYIRSTNGSFQRFDRDLSGMELLPTMERPDGDTDVDLQILYRRYEGTYFNGTSYEPGIVAEMVLYERTEDDYWIENYVSTQPIQLTEDFPPLTSLTTLAELRPDGIALCREQSGRCLLRYGERLQYVEAQFQDVSELHYDDLDDDGEKELAAIYTIPDSEGMRLSVYDWDGEAWDEFTHDPSVAVENFSRRRLYQFYDDGMAYISYEGEQLLLDLRDLWERGYWDSEPDICALSESLTDYIYQDGHFLLKMGGEILNTGGHFLRGYCFEFCCPITIYPGDYPWAWDWDSVLSSDFEAQLDPPELSEGYRTILRSLLAQSSSEYPNAYAVHDVTGDGEDELIVYWMPEGGGGSSLGTSVYNAYGKELYHGYGTPVFFDNGLVSTRWYRDPGKATGVWPYALGRWTTNPKSYYDNTPVEKYTYIGSARIRSSGVPGFEEVAYADLDGDGAVYYIGPDQESETPVDNDVYEAWVDQYLGGAKILPVMYWPLTEENISQ